MKTTPKCIIKNSVVVSLLCILSAPSFALDKDEGRNPLGCKDVGYTFELKTLHLLPLEAGATQSMYFIYNKRDEKVTLFQMLNTEESSRSMYLNHAITAKQWSVLSTTEKKMKYICTIPDNKSPYGQIVDCADSLQVCEYTNVKFGLNNRGNYWLVNSNTKNGALREVVRYGIIPAI